VVPQYRYADLLDLAAVEIWHYGAGAAQVPGRLAAMLEDLHTVALPAYQPAIAAWVSGDVPRVRGGLCLRR